MSRRKSPFRIIAAIIVTAWLAVVIFYYQQPAVRYQQVIVLDVGQGDSILLTSPQGRTVLIDGGPDRGILQAISPYLPWWDKHLDLMVLTHPHADHLNGLNYILDNYQVDKVLATGVNHTADNYSLWLQKIKVQNIELEIMDSPRGLAWDGCQLNFLYPTGSFLKHSVDNLNNTSIVSRLECGQVSFLLTGDLENEGEAALLQSGADLSTTVLKVGHHGSNTATGVAWLSAVKPQLAVISSGKDNIYSHPHQETLKHLQAAGAQILRTDQLGDIRLLTDGQTVWRD